MWLGIYFIRVNPMPFFGVIYWYKDPMWWRLTWLCKPNSSLSYHSSNLQRHDNLNSRHRKLWKLWKGTTPRLALLTSPDERDIAKFIKGMSWRLLSVNQFTCHSGKSQPHPPLWAYKRSYITYNIHSLYSRFVCTWMLYIILILFVEIEFRCWIPLRIQYC